MNLLISNTKVLTDIIFIKKVIQKSDLKKINKKLENKNHITNMEKIIIT